MSEGAGTGALFDWGRAYAQLSAAEAAIRDTVEPSPEALKRLLAARTAQLAEPPASTRPAGGIELVTFRLADAAYAIPGNQVERVVSVRSITAIPGVPRPHVGLIVFRGRVFALVDLRALIGGARVPDWRPRHALLIAHRSAAVALGADDVTNWAIADQEALVPIEEGFRRHAAVLGLVGKTTMVLDGHVLIGDARLAVESNPA